MSTTHFDLSTEIRREGALRRTHPRPTVSTTPAFAAVSLDAAREKPREVQVVWVSEEDRVADILLDGQPVSAVLPESAGQEVVRDFIDDVRALTRLTHDANFYRSLPDIHTRIDYLSGHRHGGALFGRILWHDLPGGSAVLSVGVAGGFSLVPVQLRPPVARV